MTTGNLIALNNETSADIHSFSSLIDMYYEYPIYRVYSVDFVEDGFWFTKSYGVERG